MRRTIHFPVHALTDFDSRPGVTDQDDFLAHSPNTLRAQTSPQHLTAKSSYHSPA
jgi:hypothetical protein